MLVTIDISEEEHSALVRMKSTGNFISAESEDVGLASYAGIVNKLLKRIVHELTESQVRKEYRSFDTGKPDRLTQGEIRFVKILYGEFAGAVEEIAQERWELTEAMRKLVMLHGVPDHLEIDCQQHKWELNRTEKEKQHFSFP